MSHDLPHTCGRHRRLVSASARRGSALQVAGPVLLAAGFAGFAVLALLQHENPPLPVVLAWFPVLLLGGHRDRHVAPVRGSHGGGGGRRARRSRRC